MPGANDSVGKKGGRGNKREGLGKGVSSKLESFSFPPAVAPCLSGPLTFYTLHHLFLGLLLAIFGNTDFYQSSQSCGVKDIIKTTRFLYFDVRGSGSIRTFL